jgi:hypothetical protein
MEPIKKATNLKDQTNHQGLFDKKMHGKHTENLGLEVPKNYFSKSKSKIVALTLDKKKSKLIQLRKRVIWIAAAGIALLFALTIFKPNATLNSDKISTIASDTVEKINNFYLENDKLFSLEDAVLLTSLYVDENQMDAYVDINFIDEIIIDEYIDVYILESTLVEEIIFN